MTNPTKKIAFFGTPNFAATMLEALLALSDIEVAVVVTQPDAPRGRGRSLQPSEVKKVALDRHIPCLQPFRISKQIDLFLADISSFGPFDGAVVAAYGQILPGAVLDFFGRRCINVHGSLLPRYRGAAPIQRAVMEGEQESGVCLMQMEEGLDCGPVYVEHRIAISPTTTAGDLFENIAAAGTDLLTAHLVPILSDQLCATAQENALATIAPKIEKHERAVLWSADCEQVAAQINGLSPYPGAYSLYGKERVKFGRAEARGNSASTAEPGKVVVADATGLEVACGSGTVVLHELQFPGKRMRPWDAQRNGSPIKLGEQFSHS